MGKFKPGRFGTAPINKIGGSVAYTGITAIVTATEPLTLSLGDESVILIESSAGATRLNLPDPALFEAGRTYVIKDNTGWSSSLNPITLRAAVGTTVDTSSSVSLKGNTQGATIMSDGISNWMIIAKS